jgi:hypothetical protein
MTSWQAARDGDIPGEGVTGDGTDLADGDDAVVPTVQGEATAPVYGERPFTQRSAPGTDKLTGSTPKYGEFAKGGTLYVPPKCMVEIRGKKLR